LIFDFERERRKKASLSFLFSAFFDGTANESGYTRTSSLSLASSRDAKAKKEGMVVSASRGAGPFFFFPKNRW
jgi:hypothetical protein